MDILNTFLSESKASAAADAPMDISDAKPSSLEQETDEKKAEEVRLLRAGGELLIAGCTEWDNSASKGVKGLPGPHIIQFGSPVLKSFSSSSSCFAFFLLQDGRLFAIGSNSSGQLGLGDSTCHNGPCEVKTAFPAAVVKVATGKSHSLILLSNGDVFASGANNFGQCGLGSSAKAVQGFSTFTKVPMDPAEDIACGWDHSLVCTRAGHLYTFGHPNYGQLGNGTNGEYIREGKSGSMQYNCTVTPTQVRTFLCKNKNGSIKEEYSANNVKIYRVAAGRNHSVALEAEQTGGRVFTWGFGGYGRLGHNSAEDEYRPRELDTFSRSGYQGHLPSRQVADISCGSSFTVFVTATKHLYFCGKMSNSPRGEAAMYPRIQEELYDWAVSSCAAGSNLIVASADDVCVAWGAPVAGKIGLEGSAGSTSVPKFVEAVSGLMTLDVSCGYGHVCYIVAPQPGTDEISPTRYPEYPFGVEVQDEAPSKKRKEPARAESSKKSKK